MTAHSGTNSYLRTSICPCKVIEVGEVHCKMSGLCLCLGLTSAVGDVGPVVIPQSFNRNHDLKRGSEAFPLRAPREDPFAERCIKGIASQ
jgi:hypothetical protein